MNQDENYPQKKHGRKTILGIVIALAILALLISFNTGQAREQTGVTMLALIPAAFLSGLLSFLSPCSLPILPAYFAYSFQSSKQNIVLMTIAFFMGLAATMTILGASITALGNLLVRNLSLISFIGGIIIIAFGILSIFGKGFTGVQFQDSPARTILGSFVYGATFAIGWTACIGPILGAILTLLVTQGTGIFQGAFLSFIYALGLGLPLIIISTFFSRLGNGSRFWKFIRGKGFELKLGKKRIPLHTTGIISGLLLITMGTLLLTGKLATITQLATNTAISNWVVGVDEKIRLLFGLR
ncbi:MAG: cytochrome c-type bioproteinis protein [Chloroflexi bacterium]|nr:MAG: cytochrome c-type bioproteinis protein [Chloroflexota bacterium]MBA4376403.1 cytochrome c biogenesis protein CcdA [Anaerolinea sp.]